MSNSLEHSELGLRGNDNSMPAPCRIVWLRPVGEEPTHVWIHGSGGGIESYGLIAEAMPFRSLAIDAAMSEPVDLETISVQQLADEYLSHLERVGVTGHIVLGGWSFGGVVAFAMATQLARIGRQITQVILIDSFAGPPPAGPWKVTKPAENPSTGVSAEEGEHRRNVQQAHIAALERYRPERYSGAVLSLRAIPTFDDPDAIWLDAAPDLQIHHLQADHFSIIGSAMNDEVLLAISRSRNAGWPQLTYLQAAPTTS